MAEDIRSVMPSIKRWFLVLLLWLAMFVGFSAVFLGLVFAVDWYLEPLSRDANRFLDRIGLWIILLLAIVSPTTALLWRYQRISLKVALVPLLVFAVTLASVCVIDYREKQQNEIARIQANQLHQQQVAEAKRLDRQELSSLTELRRKLNADPTLSDEQRNAAYHEASMAYLARRCHWIMYLDLEVQYPFERECDPEHEFFKGYPGDVQHKKFCKEVAAGRAREGRFWFEKCPASKRPIRSERFPFGR